MNIRNSPIKVLIAEDNLYDSQVLESILSTIPEVKLEETASDGLGAVELVKKHKPGAVFLDVAMPEMDGLSAAHIIRNIQPDIFIVFVTNHTEYAAAAFQVDAIGYLIKPVNHDAVQRVISKILKYESHGNSYAKDDQLTIKNNKDTYFIDVSRILFIERSGRKSNIHTRQKLYTTVQSLASLAQMLNNSFWRCHKSFLVNTKKIDAIRPLADRIYRISFYDYPHTASTTRKNLNEFLAASKTREQPLDSREPSP